MSKAKTVVLALLSAWQWTRRFRQPACRFYPSCSQYAKQAIEKHAIASGMWLGVVRICKCHPFHHGGVDEVPEVTNAGRRMASPLQKALIVMKSGLNPVFVGMKVRIFAQVFCLKKPLTGSRQDAKNSTISNNMLANTSRSA